MTILQALDRQYDRMEARGDVVQPGWSVEPLGAILELGADGSLLSVVAWADDKGRPRASRVPKWFSRAGTGSTPFFLWDNAAYVLGLGKKDPGKTARDHAAFRELHLRELAAEPDAGLLALCRFVAAWDPAAGPPPGLSEKLLTAGLGFRLRGETRLVHERPAAAAHVESLRAAEPAEVEGFCLVRGARLPLVRLHRKIKGVDSDGQAEIPLVSFNKDAFTSYGKEQGFNAPTSAVAAFRYGAALSALLARGGRTRMRIADATVAFWADASAYDAARAEALARAAEDIFADEFAEAAPTTDDAEQRAKLGAALQKVPKAYAEQGVTPDLLRGVSFHVLGLAPNAGRLAVRYWLSDSFARFTDALDRHAEAVAIAPMPWRGKAPSVQRLLVKTTALQESFDNIPNGLAAEVMRAVLTGAPYPRAWLVATIIRLRAGDDPARGWHAAAVKACLARMEKEETPPVEYDPDNPSAAYQLGRLFAVLEAAQYAALGRLNASIADRYYGAASATPARVFGALIRGARTHISDARKRGRGLWIESKLEQIISRLQPDLPRSLRLEDQGRFAIGYYHERAARPAKAAAESDDVSSGPEESVDVAS